MELVGEQPARGQFGEVLGDFDAALVELEELDLLIGAASAEDEAYGRLLAILLFVSSSQRR